MTQDKKTTEASDNEIWDQTDGLIHVSMKKVAIANSYSTGSKQTERRVLESCKTYFNAKEIKLSKDGRRVCRTAR